MLFLEQSRCQVLRGQIETFEEFPPAESRCELIVHILLKLFLTGEISTQCFLEVALKREDCDAFMNTSVSGSRNFKVD